MKRKRRRKKRRKKMLISNDHKTIYLYREYGTARVRLATEADKNLERGLVMHHHNGENIQYVSDPSGGILIGSAKEQEGEIPPGWQEVGY